MRRIAILLAAVGALMLVPVAQAFGEPRMTVNMAGSGSGEVTDGNGASEFPHQGSPPLACSYNGVSKSGICENTPEEPTANSFSSWLVSHPAPGSEFGGWKVTSGPSFELAEEAFGPGTGEFGAVSCPSNSLTTEASASSAEICLINTTTPGSPEPGQKEFEVTATFCKAGTAIEEAVFNPIAEANETRLVGCAEGGGGPTNLRTLTVTKSPSSSTGGGIGSVSSKPKGIKCGTACDEAVADMYKNASVELAAKPSTGSTFVKWVGGDCNGSTAPTCTIGMDKDESTEAVFGGTSKAFSPAEALTVSKGESTGKGTVKAAGLGCEAECSATTVLYQGPITEPKAKPGKTVVLKQAPAFGSKFAGWTGCTEISPTECEVKMESAQEVTAEYTALPSKTLTINKSYSSGNGSVASKPKGIKCGTTCTQAQAQMPEGASVELVAKPSTGTFVKWVGGDCNGSTSTTCVAVMNTNETIEAVFSDPGKAFSPAETLTLTKDGSGLGTVKASGLTCEVLCSSASSIYQGPITLPKAKPGKTVVLKATSAPGSKAVEWSGCDSNPTPSECVVAMSEAKEVTATFDELE